MIFCGEIADMELQVHHGILHLQSSLLRDFKFSFSFTCASLLVHLPSMNSSNVLSYCIFISVAIAFYLASPILSSSPSLFVTFCHFNLSYSKLVRVSYQLFMLAVKGTHQASFVSYKLNFNLLIILYCSLFFNIWFNMLYYYNFICCMRDLH
ncbi:hypothetical protein KFK09_028838 [Dendrobium nobile]|uniref:Uncharacterized protein n=1 Tax=Dendrobium nobile TaxID=94219 RepID=A0A8T3A306_DENNO|nr:hypothetical protein KFK09_028835 [Dendrobium nobile]KAI0488997.1 hypothetical protein KFK09_028838 [Dendrobium nobile]